MIEPGIQVVTAALNRISSPPYYLENTSNGEIAVDLLLELDRRGYEVRKKDE